MSDLNPAELAGIRILALPRYSRLGPSSRLRFFQFIPDFEAEGAVVEVSPFFDDTYLEAYFSGNRPKLRTLMAAYTRRFAILVKARRYDLVWIEKELFPFLPPVFERMLSFLKAAYVVDYDDAVFHRYDLHQNALVRFFFGNKLKPLIAGAAAVTVGNTYLADYACSAGAGRVCIVPTVVDVDRYIAAQHGLRSELRVGWIGTPANARYLRPILSALRSAAARVPLRLVTIGAPPLDDVGIQQEILQWSEDGEAAMLAGLDIGIMPLDDSPFERGKCGYKLIQYMAAGVPVIASPVGVNSEIVTADVGILADGAAWQDAFERLGSDSELRAQLGASGRNRVETYYSRTAVAPALVALFAGLTAANVTANGAKR